MELKVGHDRHVLKDIVSVGISVGWCLEGRGGGGGGGREGRAPQIHLHYLLHAQ